MSRQANPALIGGFILGAISLLVVGLVLFGSGRYFQDITTAVLYFEGDVQGLNVGAAVKFRGVKIGEVTSINTYFDPETLEVRIPVTVNLINVRKITANAFRGKSNGFKVLVDGGLRGQLRTESLVTGLLFVQLDFYPDAPAPDHPLVDSMTGLNEIPTVPTVLQEAQTTVRQLVDRLGKLPLDNMLQSLNGVLAGADKLLNAPGVQQAPEDLQAALADVRRVSQRTDAQLGPLLENATAALANINLLAAELRPVVTRAEQTLTTVDDLANKDGVRLLKRLDEAVVQANVTLRETQAAMAGVSDLTLPTSATGHQLRSTLTEVSAAARAVNDLAEALEAQPNAVIFGKQAELAE